MLAGERGQVRVRDEIACRLARLDDLAKNLLVMRASGWYSAGRARSRAEIGRPPISQHREPGQ